MAYLDEYLKLSGLRPRYEGYESSPVTEVWKPLGRVEPEAQEFVDSLSGKEHNFASVFMDWLLSGQHRGWRPGSEYKVSDRRMDEIEKKIQKLARSKISPYAPPRK